MSDPKTTESGGDKPESPEKLSEPPVTSSANSFVSLGGVGALLSALLGVISGVAGAGWPGVIALVGIGVAIPIGWSYLVSQFNEWRDRKDLEHAGEDAGNTAVDLANQGREVSQGLNASQNANPPTEGFPNQ